MSETATIIRPRDAASLVLIRRDDQGLTVLMGKRPRRSRFAPDVFVFPGGGVEAADYLACPSRPLDPACARLTGVSPRRAEALAAAALRETAEETGVRLPSDHGALKLLARAITPTQSPIRFHARFFMAEAPGASTDHADSAELTELGFRSIDQALALPLIDVTAAVLRAIGGAYRPEPFLWSYRGQRAFQRSLVRLP